MATPTDPGVPPRTAATGVVEVAQVRRALAEHYRIERVLGEGGMATVYLAEDLKHRRKVAVKVMRPELVATLGADRFLREIEIAAQLNHPHILPVHDSGSADGILYYVMPCVEGETIRERIQRETQLGVVEAVRLAREIAGALAYAHERGIVHRDIKPANILLNAGHALVADFGIARAVGGHGEALTQTGLAVGTPQYMAPEQCAGDREVDGRADVYAVGAMLYEMLAGEPPFTGPTARAILTRSLTEAPRPLGSARAGLVPAVEAVVARAMAKAPADRYQTAGALAEALDHALDATRDGERSAERAAPREVAPGPSPAQVWGLFGVGGAGMLALVYALLRRMGLPLWTFGFAVALLAIGAAVLVATGRVEGRRRAGTSTPGLGRWLTWRNAALGGGAALLLWASVATGLVLQGPRGQPGDGVVRLAVLPFQNRGAADDEYFVDGMADQVRGKLTRLGSFQVIARSSSDQYRGTTKRPGEIGGELGVDYLLTGTVTWVKRPDGSGRVQVVPELIDARSGAATWQQSFDSDITDVLQIQSSIASQVAAALGVVLAGTEQRALAERPTSNPAAYDLYLKGQAITSPDPGAQRRAAALYEQAVALDTTFTAAWGALARSLATAFANGSRDAASAARAREAADRALALDPDGAPGHLAAATVHSLVTGERRTAAEHVDRALLAAPNDADVLQRAATVDVFRGRGETALARLERARTLDPRSPRIAQAIHRRLLELRRYPAAIEAGETALVLSPTDLQTIHFQVMAYLGQGDLAGARRGIRRALGTVSAPELAAQFAGFYETSWALDEREQRVLLRLTPAAFDGDRAWWGQSLAIALWDRGERVMARAYADSALAPTREQLDVGGSVSQNHALYGVLLAYLGRRDQAVAAGERAVALAPTEAGFENTRYAAHQLARIHLALGQPEPALDQIETLLRGEGYVSAAWMRVDPMFQSLRGNPRFERLIAQP